MVSSSDFLGSCWVSWGGEGVVFLFSVSLGDSPTPESYFSPFLEEGGVSFLNLPKPEGFLLIRMFYKVCNFKEETALRSDLLIDFSMAESLGR